MAVDLLICVATRIEGDEISALLDEDGRGTIGEKSVALVETGVGCVNAAHIATHFLAREGAGALLACGVGGAYPGSELEIGDVVCAESETYADLGAETPDGFLDMEALGYPVAREHFNRLPLGLFPVPRRVPFVTRTTCTGSEASARAVVARTRGAVESMEGAALVHVAHLMDVPVGEVRGISNRVGERDRARWRVGEAARAAQGALLRWLEAGAC